MLNKNLNNFYKYIHANQINEANDEINKLLQSDPDDFLLLHCLAYVLYKKNNFLEAVKVFKKSITFNKEFVENYLNISLCLTVLLSYFLCANWIVDDHNYLCHNYSINESFYQL